MPSWNQDYIKYRLKNSTNTSLIINQQSDESKQKIQLSPKIIETDQIYQFSKQDEEYLQYLEDRFLKNKLIKCIPSFSDWRNKDKRDFRYKIFNLVNGLGMEIQKNCAIMGPNNGLYSSRIMDGQNSQQISILTLGLQKALKQILEKLQSNNQSLTRSRIKYSLPGQQQYYSFINSVGEYVKKVNQLTKPSLSQQSRLNRSYSSKLLFNPSMNLQNQKEISILKLQVSQFKSVLEQSQTENKKLQSQIKKLQQETIRLQRESTQLNQKLNKVTSQYLSTQKNCSIKQTALFTLKNAMKQQQIFNIEKIKTFKQTIIQQQREIHQMDKIQKQNIQLGCQIKQCHEQCSKLSAQVNSLITERQQKCCEIQKFKVLIHKSQVEIKQLKEGNKQLGSVKQVLTEKLNVIKSLQSNLKQSHQHRKRLQQQIKAIQTQNNQTNNTLTKKTKEIQSLFTTINEIKYELFKKCQQIQFVEGELSKRNNHVKQLENILNSKEVQNQELRDQLSRLETSYEQLKQQQRDTNYYKPSAKESKYDPMRSSMIFLKKNYDSTQAVQVKMNQSTVMGRKDDGLFRLKIFQLQNKIKELQLNYDNKSKEFEMQRQFLETQNKRLKEELSNQREVMEKRTNDMTKIIQNAIKDFYEYKK